MRTIKSIQINKNSDVQSKKNMPKILIAGAGGAPSEGVINSLLLSKKKEIILGMGSEPTDLVLSNAHKKFYIPYANKPEYKEKLIKILNKERPDLVHFQNDLEIFYASLYRDEILATNAQIFMPPHDVIDRCVHKYKTYLSFRDAGIKVPHNIMINDITDLKKAFSNLGDSNGQIWLRSSSIGGGGKGSIPTSDFELARGWIEHYKGWGNFVAAEMLTPKTITWLSIWHGGKLIVAQSRERRGWTHGNRTISGITGVTKVGMTCNNEAANKIAIASIKAISSEPHGIFGVDMAYDKSGTPNPTEINVSRFFTTILFFTKAGLNLPEIFKDIALYKKLPALKVNINPLPNGLLWLRGMDKIPRLMTEESMEKEIIFT